MFSSFFVKKPKEPEVEQEEPKEEDTKLFQEFRVIFMHRIFSGPSAMCCSVVIPDF